MSALDTDIGGSFIYGGSYDSPFDARFANKQANDTGFIDLSGGAQSKEATVALNLMLIPLENLTLIAGLRSEHQDVGGVSNYTLTSSAAAGGSTVQTPAEAMVHDEFLNVSESLEARYKGIQDWAFYARSGWEEGNGATGENLGRPDTGTVSVHRDTDMERLNQKYTVGANWYPLPNLNLGGQFYHKINGVSYTHRNDRQVDTGTDAYPGFVTERNVLTDDANFRVTWRPLNNVTAVSRYDFQEIRVDSREGTLKGEESGRSTRHVWGETLTWNPIQRLYLQGNANYVIGRTETPVNGFNGSVLESKNDYINLGLASGYAWDAKTDIQMQYSYYRADNFYNNSVSSVPYGAGAEEQGITLTLLRRISDTIHWSVKYGFFTNRDETSGDHNNYDAHVIYTSLRVAF